MKRPRILLLTSLQILSKSSNLCRTQFLYSLNGKAVFLKIMIVVVVVVFNFKICF